MFIIAKGDATKEATWYLAYLNKRFSLEIKYLQYKVGSNQLGGLLSSGTDLYRSLFITALLAV